LKGAWSMKSVILLNCHCSTRGVGTYGFVAVNRISFCPWKRHEPSKVIFYEQCWFFTWLFFWVVRVDDKLTVKVSDCALSRDLFPDDYHWMGEAESRPVKWMSPEVILQYRASAPADMVIYLLIPALSHCQCHLLLGSLDTLIRQSRAQDLGISLSLASPLMNLHNVTVNF